MEWVDWLQWPASAASLVGSWLVASSRLGRRNAGFWVFLASNGLWVVWGWRAGAPALIALQLGLAAFNIRGAVKTEHADAACVGGAGGSLPRGP